MNNETKERIQYIVAVGAMVCGVAMCFTDFFLEPLGAVHDTSLWFLGQMVAFCGTVFGISLHYNSELNNFKTEIKQNMSNG